MSTFVDLDEFLEYLRIPATSVESDEVQQALAAALEWTATIVGPLEAAARTHRLRPRGHFLILPETHLTEVVSVTDPSGTSIPVDQLEIDDEQLLAGLVPLRRPHGGVYAVTARTAGHGQSVRLAVKIIAEHLYRQRRGTGATRALRNPTPEEAPTSSAWAIPNRAADLLKPFALPGVA